MVTKSGAWEFGDVVRVSSERNPMVSQPDHRRWVVLVVGKLGREWALSYIGDGIDIYAGGTGNISHWKTMYGFDLVKDRPGQYDDPLEASSSWADSMTYEEIEYASAEAAMVSDDRGTRLR